MYRVVDCVWISEIPFLMKRMMEGFFSPWRHSSTFFCAVYNNFARFEKKRGLKSHEQGLQEAAEARGEGWVGEFSKRVDARCAGGSGKPPPSGTQDARHCGGAMPGMKC